MGRSRPHESEVPSDLYFLSIFVCAARFFKEPAGLLHVAET